MDESEDKLSKLRRALLGMSIPPAVALSVEPGEQVLALERLFEVEQERYGQVYVRRTRLAPDHLMGDVPVGLPPELDVGLLSLLAFDPTIARSSPHRVLFLDTETTGLSRGAGTLVFLMGLGWWDETGRLVVEQLFLPAPGEERPLWARVRERVQACELLVTFNGKSFDWPLVRSRLVMNRLDPFPERPHLDLLHVARRIHRHRLGSFRLGKIERDVLGFRRQGDVPSDQVAQRYQHFARTGDAGVMKDVVRHNEWDVASMASLLALYGAPFGRMDPVDMAGAADTLRKGKKLSTAAVVAQRAVLRGGGAAAFRARAYVAKALGDRDRALMDFERAAEAVDDPEVRLELAKLYEHHKRRMRPAIRMVEQGVAETQVHAEHRRARLEDKLLREQRSQPNLPGMERRGSRTDH